MSQNGTTMSQWTFQDTLGEQGRTKKSKNDAKIRTTVGPYFYQITCNFEGHISKPPSTMERRPPPGDLLSTPDSPCLVCPLLFWDLCRQWLPFGIRFGVYFSCFLHSSFSNVCGSVFFLNMYGFGDLYLVHEMIGFLQVKPTTVESHRFSN